MTYKNDMYILYIIYIIIIIEIYTLLKIKQSDLFFFRDKFLNSNFTYLFIYLSYNLKKFNQN